MNLQQQKKISVVTDDNNYVDMVEAYGFKKFKNDKEAIMNANNMYATHEVNMYEVDLFMARIVTQTKKVIVIYSFEFDTYFFCAKAKVMDKFRKQDIKEREARNKHLPNPFLEAFKK